MMFYERILSFTIDSAVFFLGTVLLIWMTQNWVDPSQAKIAFILIYYVYYFSFEMIYGQTVGKMITKTKVVSVSTLEKAGVWNILIRTLTRIFPLYFISYFMTEKGLHDHLSNTILIKSKPIKL
jgi:uncharacterized RDD family membrane protein YckC